ncbi:CGL132 [Auxenochlorella protothecoides x Auxenochlorella symbiontica]
MSRLLSFFSLRKASRPNREGSRNGSSHHGRHLSETDTSCHSAGAVFDIDLSYRGGGYDHAWTHTSMLLQQGIPLELSKAEIEALPTTASAPVVHAVRQLIRPSTHFEAALLEDVIAVRTSLALCTGSVDLAEFCEELRALGYLARVVHNAASAARPGPADGPGPAPGAGAGAGAATRAAAANPRALEKLRHSHVLVTGRAGGERGALLVVDPRFRDQFSLGHPPPAYSALLDSMPAEFVGPPERLQALVRLLCSEIAGAFAVQGQPLPPWRTLRSMLGKWFDLGAPGPGARHSPGAAPGAGEVPAGAEMALEAGGRARAAEGTGPAGPPSQGPDPRSSCAGEHPGVEAPDLQTAFSARPSRESESTASWASPRTSTGLTDGGSGSCSGMAGGMSGLLEGTFVGSDGVGRSTRGGAPPAAPPAAPAALRAAPDEDRSNKPRRRAAQQQLAALASRTSPGRGAAGSSAAAGPVRADDGAGAWAPARGDAVAGAAVWDAGARGGAAAVVQAAPGDAGETARLRRCRPAQRTSGGAIPAGALPGALGKASAQPARIEAWPAAAADQAAAPDSPLAPQGASPTPSGGSGSGAGPGGAPPARGISLLGRRLSAAREQGWSSLLPAIITVRRTGPVDSQGHVTTPQAGRR